MSVKKEQQWTNSPFYDKLYAGRNDDEAKAFMLRLVQRLAPAGDSRILVTGCGNGAQSNTLSRQGFDITGVDMAPAAIAAAKKQENGQLHFFIHDLRLPFWINYFDYSFSLFSGFGHYQTRREHDNALRTMAGSLKPGGMLVLDYDNLHFAEEHTVHNEVKTIGETRYALHSWDDEMQFYRKITVTDPSLTEQEAYTERTMKLSIGDFTEMFAFQGLQLQQVFGDYHFGEYDIRKSPRLLMIAAKKHPLSQNNTKRLYSDGRTTDALT